ncbi:hypothetical protein [Streptomyces sp. NRRL S-448]|uniref:hypothetical protein n=1 Tax=Streptomyces sp. NRRL S-448 TaxID=1463907 RepID=UPI0035620AB5
MRDEKMVAWFGQDPPIGDWKVDAAVTLLRDLDDGVLADEMAAASAGSSVDTFTGDPLFGRLFNRFMKTTHLCGFLPESGAGEILPASAALPDQSLQTKRLKITLDGLHVARYPGRGTHELLFDFVVQYQSSTRGTSGYHYNSRFRAKNGETVPVRNFPIFHGLKPHADGISFGFQTINLSSTFDQGVLDFLAADEFKLGLSLLGATNPLLGQLSEVASSLTRWIASQSKNVKVQEFRQGLDFLPGRLGAGLAEGSYIIVQVPQENANEWDWSEWSVDGTLMRLVHRGDPSTTLDFNHLVFGVRAMSG